MATGNGNHEESCEAGCADEAPHYRYGIGFCLWLTCNAECGHCLTNSSPRARESPIVGSSLVPPHPASPLTPPC